MPDHVDSVAAVLERLKQLIAEELDVTLPEVEISDSTPLFDGGIGLDSFAIVELITLIEKSFEFEFPEADLRPEVFVDLQTLASVVFAHIESR